MGTSFPWLINFLASGYLLRPWRMLDPGEVLVMPPQEQTLLSPYHTGDIPGGWGAGREEPLRSPEARDHDHHCSSCGSFNHRLSNFNERKAKL